jgi:hypothetical protein
MRDGTTKWPAGSVPSDIFRFDRPMVACTMCVDMERGSAGCKTVNDIR